MPRAVLRPVPPWRRLTRRLAGFAADECGSMTIEFVIWVPLLTYIAIGMFVMNIYLATVGEVQQVANELVRSTISQMRGTKTQAAICNDLETFTLPRVVQTMTLVTRSRFQPLGGTGCVRDAADFLTVTVSYDLTGSALSRLSAMLGFSLGVVQRRSVVQL